MAPQKTAPLNLKMKNDYTIVTGGDENYAGGMFLLLKSINRLWTEGTPLSVVILDNGLSQQSIGRCRALIAEGRPEMSLQVCSVKELIPTGLPKFQERTSVTFYARLWMAEVVQTSDLLYCDSDFFFSLNPKNLIDECRVSGVSLAAVRDGEMTIRNDCPWADEIETKDLDLPYFNSGLMYWNLNDPMFENLSETAVTLLMRAKSKPGFADQTVLNFIYRGRVHLLAGRYNTFDLTNRRMAAWRGGFNPHFTGSKKPFYLDQYCYRSMSANLVYRYLMGDEIDTDSHWRLHFTPGRFMKMMVKKWLYSIFNKRKFKISRNRLISRRELEDLHKFLKGFASPNWPKP